MFSPLFRRLALLLILNVLLLTTFVVVIWFDNSVNRGITYHPNPDNAPVRWVDGVAVGVNLYNLHLELDPQVVTRTLQLAHDLGVRYVRMQLPWDDVEIHGWGDFQDRRNIETQGVISAWAKYDRIVKLAHQLDIELILRLDRPPDWARPIALAKPEWEEGLARDSNSTGPPDNFSDYSAFVSVVAERYRGYVHYYQLWNEPNLKNEWNWQTPDPKAFTELLQLGYTAIKRADPDAVVLFPSLAPVDGLDKRAPMTELEYLDEVYNAGGGKYFDIMTAQSYGLGQPPDEHRYVRLRPRDNWSWTRPIDTRTDVSRVVLLHDIMVQHGDGNKEVWISEMGWNSAPETIPEARRLTWGQPVNETQKAAYLIGQIERARAEWPWMGVMNIWLLRYGGYQTPDPADPTPYFALVSRDWQLLPAYEQLHAYLAQPAVADVGVHQWRTHPAIEQLSNNTWRVRFRGSGIELVSKTTAAALPDEATLDGTHVTLTAKTTPAGLPMRTLRVSPEPTTTYDIHTLDITMSDVSTPSHPDYIVVWRDEPVDICLWSLLPLLLTIVMLPLGAISMQTVFLYREQQIARKQERVARKREEQQRQPPRFR